jgi:hypothetical protein
MTPDKPAPDPATPELPPGQIEVAGNVYLRDAKGSLVPIEMVKPQDRLKDDLVRSLYASAEILAKAIADFKAATFDDIDAFQALLADSYAAPIGGEKGNITLSTYDGLNRILVQIADEIEFGPELQVAKTLIDLCVRDWSAESGPELRTIVDAAFQVDKQGTINRGRMFTLLRYDITDPRWVSAMGAIRDSIRVVGSKRYVRFHAKASPSTAWIHLSLDAATA